MTKLNLYPFLENWSWRLNCWVHCANTWIGCKFGHQMALGSIKTETTFLRQHPLKMMEWTFVLCVFYFWVGWFSSFLFLGCFSFSTDKKQKNRFWIKFYIKIQFCIWGLECNISVLMSFLKTNNISPSQVGVRGCPKQGLRYVQSFLFHIEQIKHCKSAKLPWTLFLVRLLRLLFLPNF